MKTLVKTALAFGVLGSLVLFGCSDPLVQEAFFRGLAQSYRAQQMQAVTPGGQFQTGLAASIFEQLAEAKRQERLSRELQRYYQDQYARQLEEQARREQWQAQVMKARAEAETVLLEDKRVVRPWINHFAKWTEFCRLKVSDQADNPYCTAAAFLLTETQTFERRIDFYLTNLPAYFHAGMDVAKVQVEIDDYQSKRTQLDNNLRAWRKAMTELQDALKREQERLQRIEAEQRRF